MRALLLWRAPNPPFLFIFENLFLQQLSARAKGALYWNVSVPVVFLQMLPKLAQLHTF